MKLIINAASIFKGGGEQVVNSFINECKNYPDNEFYILLCNNIYDQLDIESFDSNFYFYRLNSRPASGLIHFIKCMRYFNRLEKEIQPDCVISTGGHGYWKPETKLVVGFNIPHYIYEDSPYFNMLSLKKRWYWKLRKMFDLFFYRRADAVIVQTDDVKKRLSKLLPRKPIFTVSNTVNAHYLDYEKEKTFLPEKEAGEIRLLTLSANYPHKNLGVIKKVIPELRARGMENFRFVLTLPQNVFDDFKDYKMNDYLYNVSPVPIKDCPSLYEECDFMFLPTLLECFSASYAEAMVMNKPILTSDLSFAKTVCRDAALYFDPIDPVDIANKIIELVGDTALQETLVHKGLKRFAEFSSPAERAEKFLKICSSQDPATLEIEEDIAK